MNKSKLIIYIVIFSIGLVVGRVSSPNAQPTTQSEEQIRHIKSLLTKNDPDYSHIFLLLLAQLGIDFEFQKDVDLAQELNPNEVPSTVEAPPAPQAAPELQQTDQLATPQPRITESEPSESRNESTSESTSESSLTSNEAGIQSNSDVFSNLGPKQIEKLYKEAHVLTKAVVFSHKEVDLRFNPSRFTNAKNANQLLLSQELTHNLRMYEGKISAELKNNHRSLSIMNSTGGNNLFLFSQVGNVQKVLLEISDYIFVFNIRSINNAQEVNLGQGQVYFKNNFGEKVEFTPLGRFRNVN